MRLLVIGYGSIGQRHAKNALDLGHSVVHWDIATANDSLEQFIWDMDEPPTHAVIGTYPETHFHYAKYCLEHKMNVMVEKPMCETIEAAKGLRDLATKNNQLLFVGYQMRFLDSVQTLKDMIARKGLPISGQVVYSYDIHEWRTPPYLRREGILREASHELDYLQYAFHGHGCLLARQGGYLAIIPELSETTEASAQITLGIMNLGKGINCPIQVSLDYVSPEYQRTYKFIWKDEVLHRRFVLNDVVMDQAYKDEMRAFLNSDLERLASDSAGIDTLQLIKDIEDVSMKGVPRWEASTTPSHVGL